MSHSKRTVSLLLLSALLAFILLAVAAQAQTASAPRIFYSDLESGPNTGGQNGQGTIVRVYGEGFGATQGSSTVTIGGAAAYKYFSWSDTQIAFQIGNSAATGNIVVNVSGSGSNGVPFTVRAGNIYFVATNGNDSRNGSYSKPWRTLTKARSTMATGDIVYAMNGVSATALDSASASLAITRSGSSGSPMAIVAYPGATVTIGSSTGQTYGVIAPSASYSYWVLSGLTLRGANEALNLTGSTNWRIVGNDISCPNGSGTGACVDASSANQIRFLGNNVHDSGTASSAKYDSVQFSSVNNVEAAWNKIANTVSCRALSFESSSSNQYSLSIHNNYIHNAVCDGVNLAGIDPSQGAVAVYNNIIQRVGTGPAPGGVDASYAGISVSGAATGSAYVLNNTLYDCGARANADSGGLAATSPVLVSNNIFSMASGETYLTGNTSSTNLSGSNNLFYGAGTVPAALTASIAQAPLFVSAANSDFHLQASSPAIDAGTNTGVATDYEGVRRPQGSAFDIGAYEVAGTTQSSGQLSEDVSSVDFGDVTVGGTSTKSIIVSNTGSANVTITQIQLNTAGVGFSTSGITLPATLTPGQSATLNVTFAPTVAGTATSSVSLISSASNSTSTVQLTGNGTTSSSGTGGSTSGSTATTIWSATTVPAVVDSGDAAAVELGVKFKSDVNGYITGIRFYKSATNTGTHIGNLWSSTGTKLASATFTNETASGWQQVNFSTPVAVTAGTVYTASYFAPNGHYSDNTNYFTTAFDNAPLHALQNGGVFAYGTSSAYPSQVWNASNYWVDVAFTPSTTTSAGTLALSTSSLSFGNVTVGSSSTQNVTLTAGTSSVTISQANVTGTGFSISGLTLPATIAAGQSTTFQVTFAPTTAGSATGNLSLVSNASTATSSIALSGSGVSPAGTLTASPTSLSLGNVTVGSSSTQNVTVTASTASVTISQATVSGTGFTISGLTLPATLAAGQSATFQVKFAPTTSGSATGSVALTSNASTTTTSVALSGSGVSPAGTLAASPTSLSFGNVTVGSSSTQNVTVTASTASVTISQATVTGTGFSISGLTLPATIAAGQSATFQVKFAPTTSTSVTGSVSLVSNASNTPATVSLSGTGAAASTSGTSSTIWSSSVVPGTVDAGDATAVEVGVQFKSDVNGYITGVRFYKSATNTGTHVGNLWNSSGTKLASATFTSETASGWQQVNFATPVAVTAGTVYTASYFAPVGHYSDDQSYFTSAGTDNAPLHALQNGGVFAYGTSSTYPSQTWNGSNYWVDVVFTASTSSSTGGGTSTSGTLTASPSSLSFGNVTVGSSSTQNVTVTASTASVTISQATVTGTGFSISGLTLPATIAAGQSATFQVKFTPTASGTATGSIALTSNASTATTSIALSGSGTSSTSHSVALSWTASTTSGVSGYNVYRSTTSGGSYSKVNTSTVTGTSYTDTSVTAGTTYYYVLTAISSGTESSYSSQVSAAVPTP